MMGDSFFFNAQIILNPVLHSANNRNMLYSVTCFFNFYGTLEGTFLFQYLPEKKSKQKELERK